MHSEIIKMVHGRWSPKPVWYLQASTLPHKGSVLLLTSSMSSDLHFASIKSAPNKMLNMSLAWSNTATLRFAWIQIRGSSMPRHYINSSIPLTLSLRKTPRSIGILLVIKRVFSSKVLLNQHHAPCGILTQFSMIINASQPFLMRRIQLLAFVSMSSTNQMQISLLKKCLKIERNRNWSLRNSISFRHHNNVGQYLKKRCTGVFSVLIPGETSSPQLPVALQLTRPSRRLSSLPTQRLP